jgi:hypothetical protein
MKFITIFFVLSMSNAAIASTKWANCMPVAQSELVAQEFWNSDINGGAGPDYTLKSGQLFSNAGNVCKQGKILSTNDWISELKGGINPAKSITLFKAIKDPTDLLKLLANHKVEVNDDTNLKSAIANFLQLPSDKSVGVSGTPHNPTIIVGESSKEILIVLATSDGKSNAATLMKLKLN